MHKRSRLTLTTILIVQQLTFAVPATATVNTQAGKPLDLGSLQPPSRSGTSSPVVPSLTRGEATLRIPIVAPPGTGGFTPEIALAYDSGASRRAGPLGVGWSLDVGPDVIQRSTRNGAPSFDANDSFEISGRLLIETKNGGQYTTENHDFRRILHITSGGDDYWLVLSPDGTRRYYGYHHGAAGNDSKVLSTPVYALEATVATCPDPFVPFPPGCFGRESIVDPFVPFAWHLDRIEDRNGNVIQLDWSSFGDSGVRYLTAIRYSDHVSGSATSVPDFGGADDLTISRTRVIRFTYDPAREDIVRKFSTGFARQFRRRLSDIHVEIEDDSPQVPTSLVRHYLLEYEYSPASGRSRLRFIRDRGASDSATNEFVQTFEYGDGGTAGWSPLDGTWSLPAGLAFVANGQDQGVRLIDVDNDGYPDVVRANSGVRQTYLGGPTGFATSPTPGWAAPLDFKDAGGFAGTVTGDFDGDGRVDLMQRRLAMTGENLTTGACGASRQHEAGVLTHSTWINSGSGWTEDSDQDPAPEPYNTLSYPLVGNANSCPYENLNTSSSLNGVNVGLDQATRVVDVNGDGLDDLLFKRTLDGSNGEGTILWDVREFRAGVLLNSEDGLASGTLNNHHESRIYNIPPNGNPTTTDVLFMKVYDEPTWQPPMNIFVFAEEDFWSSLLTCVSTSNRLTSAHSGKERIVDANGDGLPDILEYSEWRQCGDVTCPVESRRRLYLNNGYGWFRPSGYPDKGFFAPKPVPFYSVTQGVVTNTPFSCVATEPGVGSDSGVRLIDVNGDGGVDHLGGDTGSPSPPGTHTSLWDARVPNTTVLSGEAWQANSSWDTPVSFGVGDGEDTGVRLADVNADGMIDIVLSTGAYLNQGEPPDRLTSITSPFGAKTTIEYLPNTEIEAQYAGVFAAPTSIVPAIDPGSQLPHGGPIWVVSRITTDSGAPFLQPTVSQEFAYFGPIHDIEDRGFRGFTEAISLGPVVAGERRVTRRFFHMSDSLRGSEVGSIVSVAPATTPGAGSVLFEGRSDYSHGTGAPGAASVTYASGATASLSSVDPDTDQSAYADFKDLFLAPADGSRAHLAFRLATEADEVEGTGPTATRRLEQSFDVFGNVTSHREIGDVADLDDDVTTDFQYALLEMDPAGNPVLLADRPVTISVQGQLGSLPLDTVIQRDLRFFYDSSTVPGDLVRGNPTSIDRQWSPPGGGITWVRTAVEYDVYGNVERASSPFDESSPGTVGYVDIVQDPETNTFPTDFVYSTPGDPTLTLATSLEYEIPGCGGPKGMGLVCRTLDANNAARTQSYDDFGRDIGTTGPNGAETFVDYHDLDRAGVNQRTEIRHRWDPTGPPVATDPDAIITETFFDGLGRTLKTTRVGLGAAVASRSASYDAAGQVASTTRWVFGSGTGPSTTYTYDVLGRLETATRPDLTLTEVSYAPRQVTVQRTEPDDGLVHKRSERTDASGRIVEVDEYEDPSAPPARTDFQYDPFGQLVRVTDPMANGTALCGDPFFCPNQLHTTEILYDELGYRTRLIDPDTGTWLTDFDPRGFPALQTDPRGVQNQLSWDALGRLESRIALNPPDPSDPSEGDHVYTYGLVGTTVPNGLGRLIRVDDAEGYDEFEYDDAGNVSNHVRVIAGKKHEFEHTTDPIGRRVETIYPDGETVTWQYDGRLLTRIWGVNGTYSGDYVADVGYDPLDRVSTLLLGGNQGAPVVAEIRLYDGVSGQLDRILANASGQPVADLDYTVDGVGRVRSISHQTMPVGGTGLEARSFSYDYDGLDRLLTSTGSFHTDPQVSDTLTFSYDALGNLVQKNVGLGNSEGWVNFYFDPVRPRASDGAIREGLNGSIHFEYDAAGNVTQKDSAPGNTTDFKYDSIGQLTRMDTSRDGSWRISYSALGQRVLMDKINEKATLHYPEPGYEYHRQLGLANKHFFVAGKRVASSATAYIAPNEADPPLLHWRVPSIPTPPAWVFLLGYGMLVALLAGLAMAPRKVSSISARVRLLSAAVLVLVGPGLVALHCGPHPPLGTHSESAVFYVTDHLGSTVVAIDTAGAVRNRYIYRPFGDRVLKEGPTLHHQFAGEEGFESSFSLGAGDGFYAIGQRFYDADLGRFLQPDTIVPNPADPQTFNRYAYALNDPVNKVDPTGFESEGAPDLGGVVLGEFLDLLRNRFGGDGTDPSGPASGATNVPNAPTTGQLPPPSQDGDSFFAKFQTVAGVIADVAGVVAYIPGPIGTVAAGAEVMGRVIQGDLERAAEAGVGILTGGKLLAKGVGAVGKAAKGAAQKATRGGGRGTDFIVSPDGAVSRSSPAAARKSLDDAGMKGRPVTNRARTETGTVHNVPGQRMDVRIMDGGPTHGPRAVTTRQGTKQPVNPRDGSNFGDTSRSEQRSRSHIPLPD